jgi:Rrf2 family transcriptional regulator, iron-sulfur cluster assembly transcription factor
MLSNSCRYGIRAVIYLAGQPSGNEKTGIKKISRDLDLPMPFLAKILQQLAKQKILNSSKGPHGGFSLLQDPKKVTLIDIVNSIDGRDVFTNCIIHSGSCEGEESNKKQCALHNDYQNTRFELMKLFSNKTIYDLVVQADNNEQIVI